MSCSTESSRSEEKLCSDSTVLETEITDCASPDRPFLIRPSEVAHGEHPCRFQKFHKSLLKYSVVKPTCQSKACGGGQLYLRYPKKDALLKLKDEKKRKRSQIKERAVKRAKMNRSVKQSGNAGKPNAFAMMMKKKKR